MWPVVKPEGRGEGEEGVVCLWSGCAVQWLVGVKVQHYLAPPSWCFIWMNTLRTTNTILHQHLPFSLTPTTTQHSSLQIQNNNKQYFFTSALLASGVVNVIFLHLLLILSKWNGYESHDLSCLLKHQMPVISSREQVVSKTRVFINMVEPVPMSLIGRGWSRDLNTGLWLDRARHTLWLWARRGRGICCICENWELWRGMGKWEVNWGAGVISTGDNTIFTAMVNPVSTINKLPRHYWLLSGAVRSIWAKIWARD